jgi:glycosyltransferase EpsF
LKKAIATPLFRMLYMAASTQKIACSKDAGSFLYGNNKTTQVIYNAIDIEPYLCISEKDVLDLRQELGILKSDVVIGHVARMCEMKNQKFIIELARRNKDAEHIKFLLVGDGQEFGVIQEMAKELPNVILTGRRSDVPTIMKSCDCIILPSLPGEGFPVTMIEAQAAGCCCITSAHVTDEVEVGLDLVTRIPLTDLESWDSSIVSLKRNSDFNHRDECARKLLEYGFGKDTFINKWKNLYN